MNFKPKGVMSILSVPQRMGHLFRRAGFGATPMEVETWSAKGLEGAVNALMAIPAEPESIAFPAAKQLFNPDKTGDIQALWLHRMATTQYPLVEKMTLFWHGHFTSGIQKVRSAPLMQRQNELLRRHALGSFPALLRAMGKDGAMLHWLDGNGSKKKSANENYAREVMELFTTGPGPYTETDVKEAARAFTGWRLNRDTLEVSFLPRQFDAGVKTFLGKTGPFKADDIADVLSTRPETAKFLATKLWRFFASPTPDSAIVAKMTQTYLDTQGDMAAVLRVLFLAEEFYAESVMGAQIKSPAEFVAGTLRILGLPGSREAAAMCNKMGQVLYDPPNVAGWFGGPSWLGASAVLARWNFGEGVRTALGQKSRLELAKAAPPSTVAFVDQWLTHMGITGPSEATRMALSELVGETLPKEGQPRWEATRSLIRTIIAAPEYQVT